VRFLHTGDWHIGKTLRGRSRDDEYRQVLDEVLGIARTERVDCVLIAGDVFDTVAPPPEAHRIVFEFFRELAGARIPAVVIGGNHDDPRRLNAFAQVLDLIDIHVRGEPVMGDQGGVVEITSRDGEEKAIIAALPWVREGKARSWEGLQAEPGAFLEYGEHVGRTVEHLCRAFREDTVNVLLAHVMMDGAIVGEGGGERPLHVGQAYALKPQRLPADAHYIALGHVHRPQAILPGRAFYSGSLLQLDFGEAGQQKSVNIVEAAPGRPAYVATVPLSKGRPLYDIGQRDRGIPIAELGAIADDPQYDEAYLRVFVAIDGPVPDLARHVRELLPDAVDIQACVSREESAAQRRDLMAMSPTELFQAYCRERAGGEPPTEMLALFERLYDQATQEELALATA